MDVGHQLAFPAATSRRRFPAARIIASEIELIKQVWAIDAAGCGQHLCRFLSQVRMIMTNYGVKQPPRASQPADAMQSAAHH